MIEVQFREYCRPFVQPLQTRYGLWRSRQGLLVRLKEGDRTGWGEIAPLENFGSESFAQALDFCRSLPSCLSPDIFEQIPSDFPACRFGLESAWEVLRSPSSATVEHPISLLLPTGSAALSALPQEPGTFKWKIGVAPISQELEVFQALVKALPQQSKLRLDANGGLTAAETERWLQICDRVGVEFLEQPLAPPQFDLMLDLSQRYETPIALDESVATVAQLEQCYERGWRGIFVVKAAIAGSPARLRSFCQRHPVDIVWSSVFETAIGQAYIQSLIPSVPTRGRAIGFGVNHWFNDGLNQMSFEQIWQSL